MLGITESGIGWNTVLAAVIGGACGLAGVFVKVMSDMRAARRGETKDHLSFEEQIRRELLEGQVNVVKQANERAAAAEKRADELTARMDALTEDLNKALQRIRELEATNVRQEREIARLYGELDRTRTGWREPRE